MLKRYVEVYCWKENISTRTERRGKQSRTVTDYTYTTTWLPTSEFRCSSTFKDKKYNNVAPNIHSELFRTKSDLVVGDCFKLCADEL